MIVDSHVYCFRAPDHTAGHPTVADHMKLWQWGYALHHQPAYRTRDRAPGNSLVLLDPAPDDPLRLATDKNFRVDHTTNRLVWTMDGDEYTKQYLPPNVVEYSAGQIIAEMDYAGIDWALMHVDNGLEKDPAFLGACVRAYPDRLRSMAPIDEWEIPVHPDKAIRQATEAIQVHGLHALKIIPEYAYRIAGSQSFDEPAWRPFWDAVTKLGVPIFFSLGSSPGSTDDRQGFIDELWVLRRWLDRYPDVVASVTHGFPWRAFVEGDRFVLPATMWEPFKGSSLAMEVSFPIRIGDWFDYPWRESWPALAAMVENIGPDRLLWGTDMPFQNRFCTYRQSHEYIERHCQAILSGADLEKVMGGTAARILKIPTPSA
jgi:predicted TIM-barrel fold metal-dependent hydrolase